MQQLEIVDGSYRSPERRISLLARQAPSLVFYLKYFSIVFRSAWVAYRGRYDDQTWTRGSQTVLRALESVGLKFQVEGLQHLAEPDGPCVIAGNHMSALETMVLPGFIEPIRHHTYVVKQPLLDYPFFKYVMRSRDPVAVSQYDPREDLKAMLEGGVERLQKGVSLVVFPQSKRNAQFDPSLFNSIAVKIARRANVPIVPMALETSAWALGKIALDVGWINPSQKVHLAFGPPITIAGRGAEAQETLLQFVLSKLREWNSPGLEACK